MKFIIAAFVFILALSITFKTVASEAEVCTAEKKEHCVETKSSHEHAPTENAHKEKLGEEMNSLFPQKQKNPAASGVPAVVTLTAPKFLSKISGQAVKLEWVATEGASNYHVQVATDPNFKWLVANDPWVKANSFEATQLEADKKYYWRVASLKNQNDSMFTKSLFVSSVFSTNP